MGGHRVVSRQIAELDNILQTSGLNKSFGRLRAVRDLGLEVPRGAVFGILGPNGSGKSTTLSMLLGILRPDSGRFSWFGEPEATPQLRRRIGSTLEQPNFYSYLSARRNLEVAALIKEAPYSRIPVVLDQVGLLPRAESAFRTFSTGMKQRLALASALLADPEVLVLDEPTNGLDPRGIAEVRELVQQVAAMGKTILLASHILDEVEKVCTHVAVIKQGVLLAQGSVASILGERHQVELGSADPDALERALRAYPLHSGTRRQGRLVVLSLSQQPDSAALNRYLMEQGIVLDHLQVVKKRLEEQFLELTSAP